MQKSQCPNYETILRVVTERGTVQEAVSLIHHTFIDDCNKCRTAIRSLLEERLKSLEGDPIFADSEKFMDRKKRFAEQLIILTESNKK